MYDILAYLYENCRRTDLSDDNQLIAKKLSAAGFEDSDISEALSWLAGMLHAPHRIFAPVPVSTRSVRAYAPKECAKLDASCRGRRTDLLPLHERCARLWPRPGRT